MPGLNILMVKTPDDDDSGGEVHIDNADKVVVRKETLTLLSDNRTVGWFQRAYVKGVYLDDDSEEQAQFTVEEKIS